MKKLFIISICILVLGFTGCSVFKAMKGNPKPESTSFVVKTGHERTENVILQELLSQGEVINKDVFMKKTFEQDVKGEYQPIVSTTEFWTIQTGDDFHVAVFEQGILMKIEPVESLETAKKMFKPYGKWNIK